MIPMIAAYVRVSTAGQKTDLQRKEIAAWANAHGIDDIRWYEDVITGKSTKRPGLDALQADVFAGKVKTILIWKLDRLGRSMIDAMNIIVDWCNKDVRLVSVTQQIDLSGTIGHIVAAVLLGIGQKELEHIRERQAAGIALAKERGAYTGRQKGTTKATPSRAKELRNQGFKIKEIAQAMGVSESSIKRYLN